MPSSGEPTADLGRALQLLQQLADLPPAQRQHRLHDLCRDDAELRAQVERMLGALPAASATTERRSGRFGRYTLRAFVGDGGMGEVYRAEQDHPRREVALKLLHPGPASAAMVQRIQREASVLARLSHPGIAQVFDAGTVTTAHGEEPFLAIEFVDGESLLAAAGPLPLRQQIELLADLCDAVDHAHGRGVIHCDLKPDNIMVERAPEGLRLRVLDFGIAVVVAETAAANDANKTAGTLAYMGPERIDGQIDVRGDVYSIGAVGYQLLAGKPPVPIRGLTILEAVTAVRLQVPAALGQANRHLRGDIEAIFAKALAKDPAQRYASAAEFARDLRRWLDHEPVLARKRTPLYVLTRFARRRRALTAALLTVAVSAALGIGGTVAAADRAQQMADELSNLTAKVIDEVGPYVDEAVGGGHVRREILSELELRLHTVLTARPDDARLRHAFADLLQLQSNLARDGGRYTQAMSLRRQNLSERLAMVERLPGDLHALHDLAIAWVLIGDVHKELGQYQDVREPYEKAHALFIRIAQQEPSERRALDDLACSHARLGDLSRIRRDFASARVHLDACGDLVHALTAAHPEHRCTRALLRMWNSIESVLASDQGDHSTQRQKLEAAFASARALSS